MARIISSDYLSLDFDIQTKKKLNKLCKYVDNLMKMQTDKKFQKFILKQCTKTLDDVINTSLIGGTTNDEQIEEYIKSNHVITFSNGFIMYNDAKVEANATDYTKAKYPEGQFSIALAFEYGVGVVGQESSVSQNAWQYDVNGHGDAGWVFIQDNGIWERTRGYAGFNIYGQTAEIIMNKLPEWVNEYMEKKV